MKVWELKSGSVNDFAPLVFASDKDVESGMFDTTGASLSWSSKPKVDVFVEPGKKKPKPLADVSALTPGALVMNARRRRRSSPSCHVSGSSWRWIARVNRAGSTT